MNHFGLIAITLIGVGFANLAQATELKCKVYGLLNQKDWKYKTIVEGSFKVSKKSFPIKPGTSGGKTCTPYGVKSQIFTNAGEVNLQLAAWRCGTRKMYFTQKIRLHGLSVVREIDRNKISRIGFNEDDTVEGIEKSQILDPPIELQAGSFKFIYSDCKTKNPKRQAHHSGNKRKFFGFQL